MPLSDTEAYTPGHWGQVQRLIIRAANKAGFTASMVSENAAEDMIQASIVRNIYHNDVVVCDVSSLNPNVMLELGLRMATLLPLVLVFDGEKDYPFDIKNILREGYPKSLHIFKMETFVDNLAEKIKQVHEAQKNKEYAPFLSHFKEVTIEPARLESSTQSVNEALETILAEVASMRGDIKRLQHSPVKNASKQPSVISDMPALEREFFDRLYSALRDSITSSNKERIRKEIVDAVITELYKDSGQVFKQSRRRHIDAYSERVMSEPVGD
ncbi:hypothetical protein JAO77_20100 [Hymenobacter sp. BT559]|nr:hypothetical protein [Hymenobacter sp. BT559]